MIRLIDDYCKHIHSKCFRRHGMECYHELEGECNINEKPCDGRLYSDVPECPDWQCENAECACVPAFTT